MLHYLKFFHYYLIALVSCLCLVLADGFIYVGFAVFVCIYAVGDAILGDDISTPKLSNKLLIDAMLYSALPMSLLILTAAAWLVTPGDWLVMTYLSSLTGYDFAAAKANTSLFELLVGVVFIGFLLSGLATVVAHELVHRVGKKWDVTIGRILMSFSFDANFSIEHVFHHHAKVATEHDPVTAPRGRNVYTHLVRAVIGTNVSAWNIEKTRLIRKKQSVFSYHNKCLRGYGMSILYVAFVWVLAGWQAALFLSLIGITAKLILEVVNYTEHYGLVRHERQPVKPKHSWNSNRKISNWAMFNLPRHSHHHARAAVPFEKLEPMTDSPEMISGYISTVFIALVPPLWFALMKPRLEKWDAYYANQEELDILYRQSQQRQAKHPLMALFY